MKKYRRIVWTVVGSCGVSLLSSATGCTSSSEDDCVAGRSCAGQHPEEGGAGPSGEGGSGEAAVAGGSTGDPAPAGAGGALIETPGASAGEGGARPAPMNSLPYVISVSPSGDAEEVEPDAVVTVAFSEPLSPDSVGPTSMKLLDGDREVAARVTSASSKITLTPVEPLALLGSYTVRVSNAVTDLEGAALNQAFESSFSVRDGKFETITAVDEQAYELADTLPMSPSGAALLTWVDMHDGDYCPTWARWFLRGAPVGEAQAFTAENRVECHTVSAAINPQGVAAVGWQISDAKGGIFVQQYRDENWMVEADHLSDRLDSTLLRLGVSPTGVMSLIYHAPDGTTAYRTDAAGVWAGAPAVLSSSTEGLAAPQMAFDANGDGLAVWRARTSANREQILFSRYSTSSGKWSTAAIVNGSAAAQAGADYARGVPALAMDPDGNAVALWVKHGPGSESLVASHFSPQTGWNAPLPLAPELLARPSEDAPGLAFDGQTFVAAFTGDDGQGGFTYTSRFDAEQGAWTTAEKRQAASEDPAVARMPKLAADGRGNLIVVWASMGSPHFKLLYQRYAGGSWGATQAVPGGNVGDPAFVTRGRAWPLTVSANGLAALAWGNDDSLGSGTMTVRLASFY